jgi:hypothetical protein
MQPEPFGEKRTKQPGYKSVLVSWHESIGSDFDPVATLMGLAESHGLVVRDKVTKSYRRLRFDTVESSQLGPRRRSLIDKAVRQDAAKLLRRALSNPHSAERIKGLVERARQGEDVRHELAGAIDLASKHHPV